MQMHRLAIHAALFSMYFPQFRYFHGYTQLRCRVMTFKDRLRNGKRSVAVGGE
ncbi:hypothetical protein VFPPC_15154 [Pochonia chlamydosporia 170]|uniref:Uncharacterized protein n=1 Tax=Pochonia chlamydosporia 170 TaxID=1380566 RepID=A0A179G589_METCM|nr:hypothetical protein VFPPC_15154 [Pochonia chlamydosporia 170]OAQ72521.1 hypothetical protein VFPPC_15154 [Pochonia chlamydosporia 170]